jgi:hypothetical protein
MMLERLLCLLRGHRWQFVRGVFIDGKTYPAIDMYECECCRESKTQLFRGGL